MTAIQSLQYPNLTTMIYLLLLPIAYFLVKAIYNLFFHPLSRFPGPTLGIISRVPYVRSLYQGDFHQAIKALHEQYGPIVRVSANELSITDAKAWQDIYGYHKQKPNFPKNPTWMRPSVNGTNSIIASSNADHSRIRRLLAHAFSEKALRGQEPLLQSYVDLLIARLREKAKTSANHTANVDIVQWFNFTTFDITGDLSFGESFHCLENGIYHPWISMLFGNFKAVTLGVACRMLPGFETLLHWVLPKDVMQKRIDHFELARGKVHKRIKQGDDPRKPDFMSYVLRYNDEKGMTVPEIEATFSTLIIAGSETTATALSGIVHHLFKSLKSLEELTIEIRSSFKRDSDITLDHVTRLPFLNAVIEEGLRLCPPVPSILPRLVPPEGAYVCGYWLPGNTEISIPQYASSRSTTNFSNPNSFIPHRWLQIPDPSGLQLLPFASSLSIPPPSPQNVHNPVAFNPFSIGPRNCIGRNLAYLEMRLILVKLIWNFDLVPVRKVGEWGDQKTYILWQKEPLEVGLRNVER
ncbi:hypothetical protein MMC18_005087 [Xylographa bjoerkii]|nr:hypothetical protein [Xylographa bjoerkii]